LSLKAGFTKCCFAADTQSGKNSIDYCLRDYSGVQFLKFADSELLDLDLHLTASPGLDSDLFELNFLRSED